MMTPYIGLACRYARSGHDAHSNNNQSSAAPKPFGPASSSAAAVVQVAWAVGAKRAFSLQGGRAELLIPAASIGICKLADNLLRLLRILG